VVNWLYEIVNHFVESIYVNRLEEYTLFKHCQSLSSIMGTCVTLTVSTLTTEELFELIDDC